MHARSQRLQGTGHGDVTALGPRAAAARRPRRVFAVAENYPDLKAGPGLPAPADAHQPARENTIADRRELYNEASTINKHPHPDLPGPGRRPAVRIPAVRACSSSRGAEARRGRGQAVWLTRPDFFFWLLMLGVAVVGGGWIAFPLDAHRAPAGGHPDVARPARRPRVTSNSPAAARRCGREPPTSHRSPAALRLVALPHPATAPGPASRGRQRTRWQTVNSGRSEQPFLLDDGNGPVRRASVGRRGADGRDHQLVWRHSLADAASRAGAPLRRAREYRYYEERIYENEQVHVLGQFPHPHGRRAARTGGRRRGDLRGMEAGRLSCEALRPRTGDGRGEPRGNGARTHARHVVPSRSASSSSPLPPAPAASSPAGGPAAVLIASIPASNSWPGASGAAPSWRLPLRGGDLPRWLGCCRGVFGSA